MSRTVKVLAVAAVALTTVGVTPFLSFAGESRKPAPASIDIAPGMLAAMKRDLKLTDAQIATRLRTEAAAPVVEKNLRSRLGARFAGAWIPAGATRLTVAVTDPALAAQVRAGGADVTVVRRDATTLDAAKAALDKHARQAGSVRGWYVDVATNSVVVMAKPGAEAAARSFAAAAGAGTVSVVSTAEAPRPMYDIRGGDQYTINGNMLCSVGFAVSGGFVSAGHCGTAGSSTLGYNNVAQGTFAASVFPGNDYSWIRTNGNWTSQPWVNNYAGGMVLVSGSQDAAVGSSVCRSGRTTGWRCGTILGRNETIVYSQGAVSGLTRSNACAEPGDSGGSWTSGNQAQGVTSGGTGNCTSGGTMWFQPVNPILQRYGLTLTTTSGGGGGGGSSTSSVVSNWNGKCVDVPSSIFTVGARLQMWVCNGTDAQKWTFVNGTLRAAANNLCMDVTGGGTAAGTPIQIVSCNGHPAQQWVLTPAGDLVNPQSNRCLDITDWNDDPGAPLSIADCTGGANQKWHRA